VKRGGTRSRGTAQTAGPGRRAARTVARLSVLAAATAVATLAFASLAIPSLRRGPRPRPSSHRTLYELRAIVESQREVRARALVDRDRDGIGESATLDELSGVVPLRGTDRRLAQPLRAHSGGSEGPDGVVRSGWYFIRIDLPAAAADGRVLPASHRGEVDPDLSEDLWQAYAWPAFEGLARLGAFHVGIDGIVRGVSGPENPYAGRNAGPRFDAALRASRPGDLASPVADGVPSNDGLPWRPVPDASR